MDFIEDPAAIEQPYQYMFGKAFLVAPVTEPDTEEWNIYLPKGSGWYDFWTGEKQTGGQTVKKETPIDIMPLFVKAGSILPVGPDVQYATEKKWDNLEIRIYDGADGSFVLYEDENDNYNYEKGAYSTITFTWNDSKKRLTINDRKGSFPGMLHERKFSIVRVPGNKGTELAVVEKSDKEITYEGKKITIKF
jgi:alpha-D-xyloside xylohydrolase